MDRSKGHHIYCNFAGPGVDPKTCHQCKGLWDELPYETEEDLYKLIQEKWPGNVKRS